MISTVESVFFGETRLMLSSQDLPVNTIVKVMMYNDISSPFQNIGLSEDRFNSICGFFKFIIERISDTKSDEIKEAIKKEIGSSNDGLNVVVDQLYGKYKLYERIANFVHCNLLCKASPERIKEKLLVQFGKHEIIDAIFNAEQLLLNLPRFSNYRIASFVGCGYSRFYCGSFCLFAPNVRIQLSKSHKTDSVSFELWGYEPFKTYQDLADDDYYAALHADIRIGNSVWIGGNCTIMPGVTIGDGAVLAMNSHVVKNVGPYEVVGGNPAKLIRKRFTDTQINALLELKWWDLPDERIKPLVPYLCGSDVDLAIQKIRETREALNASP